VVPEVHNELLGLAHIQYKTVVVAPSRQLGYLVSVLSFIAVAYQADNCGVICKLDDPVATVSCEYSCGLKEQPCGVPVLRMEVAYGVEEVLLPIVTP